METAPSQTPGHETELRRIVFENDAFMAMLRHVREVAPPNWCVGAGAIRALVWDKLHGRQGWHIPRDIDVAYYDPQDLSGQAELSYQTRLREGAPALPWDVVNQARVHQWYGARFGIDVQSFRSMEEAVATWPEYASCVAVSLGHDGHIGIVAPYGLEDLFALVIRRNPARVSVEEYRRRVEVKKYAERWPGVRIIDAECIEVQNGTRRP